MQVAKTILEQLGGNKFIAMTGAKNFLADGNALTFKLPGSGGFTKNGINYVRVTLTPADLYDMEFSRVRGMKVTSITKYEGIYNEQLQDLFETATGLRTKLF